MTTLVSKTDLDNFKQIADSVKNETDWLQCVQEAQTFDVKGWLGDGLLSELLEQAASSPEALSTANKTLLNGGDYTYNERTYMLTGLKACIIYYAFARYINTAPFNFTQAGITVKESDFSTPATPKDLQSLRKQAWLNAEALKDEIVLYLNRNSTTYPLFTCGMGVGRPRSFYTIGK